MENRDEKTGDRENRGQAIYEFVILNPVSRRFKEFCRCLKQTNMAVIHTNNDHHWLKLALTIDTFTSLCYKIRHETESLGRSAGLAGIATAQAAYSRWGAANGKDLAAQGIRAQ